MVKKEPTQTIEITFDTINFCAKIRSINISDNTWSQIYLLCRSVSEDITKSQQFITLPWFEFRRVLRSISKFVKEENIHVIYDNYAKKLISDHFEDILSLQNHETFDKASVFNLGIAISNTNFKRKLTPEQLRDASKMIGLKNGANFSVPGAGKTSTLLAIHAILKEKGKFDKLLVVAPRNAFISWEDEIKACFEEPLPHVVRITGGKENISKILVSDPEIALITYHQLPYVISELLAYLQRNQVHLVLDESHRIKKGMSGVHYVAAVKLADFASRRDILTGTPLPQSSLDIVSQFDFLWPGERIFEDIQHISDEQKRIDFTNKKVKPLYSRTTKSELGLKKPIIKLTRVKLGPIQQELYDLLRSEAARESLCTDKKDIIAFRKLGKHVMRLLQIASNPMLITSNDTYEEETYSIPPGTRKWELLMEFSRFEKPAKIEYTLNRVRELVKNGQKVVVWSCFVQNIELLEKCLSDLGAVSIHGSIETGDENESNTREGRIRLFHESPNCRVLIANPAACGEGISLHKICHYALYLDRTFNAGHYLQSVDRIHRLGLDPGIVTNVEILQSEDTIDTVVESRLRDKIKVMSDVLEDSDLRALAYDPEDIIEDLPGGIDKEDVNEIQEHIRS